LSSDPLVELSAYHHVTSMAVSSRESESGHSSVSSDSIITLPANNCDSSSSCAGLHSILCLHLINIFHWTFFSGIIGELYGNNREAIREIQNRILGTIMGIIGSGLIYTLPIC